MPLPTRGTCPTLCVGILTLNEERRIKSCIQSAAFADQIIVIDSGSTDRTTALAESLGAEVFHYPDWQGFGVQRTRLLQHCRCDYIFFLDADEEITPELRTELLRFIEQHPKTIGEIVWQQVAFGAPLRHMLARGALPRLFPAAEVVAFEGAVHEGPILRNPRLPRRRLKSPLLHYSRETIHDSLRKLTQYSMLGAAKRKEAGRRGGIWRGLGSGLAIFARIYIFRLALLDRGPGFLFSVFVALECFFRYVALEYDREHLSNDVKR